MSYNASGHNERVNYFSNPNVNLPETGTATGEAGISNNAAVLTKNRFNISAVGDESGKCDHGPKGKIDGKIITSSKKIISGLFSEENIMKRDLDKMYLHSSKILQDARYFGL